MMLLLLLLFFKKKKSLPGCFVLHTELRSCRSVIPNNMSHVFLSLVSLGVFKVICILKSSRQSAKSVNHQHYGACFFI